MHIIFKCSNKTVANIDVRSNFSLSKGQIVNFHDVRYTIWQIETEIKELIGESPKYGDWAAEYKTIVHLEKI